MRCNVNPKFPQWIEDCDVILAKHAAYDRRISDFFGHDEVRRYAAAVGICLEEITEAI